MSARPPSQVEVIDGLIRIERVRAYAYRTAAASGWLDGKNRALAERCLAHSRARAAVLRTQLEALGAGLDGSEPLELDGEPVVRDLAAARDEPALLRVLVRLERVAIDTAARAQARLEVPELMQTVATVMGGHAQQLAALRTALGEDPV